MQMTTYINKHDGLNYNNNSLVAVRIICRMGIITNNMSNGNYSSLMSRVSFGPYFEQNDSGVGKNIYFGSVGVTTDHKVPSLNMNEI